MKPPVDPVTGRRLCRCHGEPMYPNNSRGGWRCRVKVRERQNAAEGTIEYWVKRRRRHLGKQRVRLEAELERLHEEMDVAGLARTQTDRTENNVRLANVQEES
jgi:hypothetical protein